MSGAAGARVAGKSVSDGARGLLAIARTEAGSLRLPPPAGVTDPTADGAVKFGTVPAIAAMTTPSGTVDKEPGASATLVSFAKDPSTPFTFIGTTVVKVPSGSPIPAGRIQIVVSGRMSAGPF